MLLRILSGSDVRLADLSIQTFALLLFGLLLVKDRDFKTDENTN